MSENATDTKAASTPDPKGASEGAQDNAQSGAQTAAGNASTATDAGASGSPGESPEIQALRAKLGLSKKAPESASPKDGSAESTAKPASDTGETTTPASDAQDTTTTSTDDDVDTSAATGAALLARKDRALKEKSEKLKSAAKEVSDAKAELAPVLTAREKFKSAKDAKERAVALLELVGGAVTIDDVSELSALAGQERPALTETDVDKLVAAKLEAAEKAAKEARERADRETAERITASEAQQVEKAKTFLQENKTKYPAVVYRGLSGDRYVELMKEGFKATGKIPTADVIYDFVEQEYRAEAKAQLLSVIADPAPAKEEPKPSKTVSASDKRGVVTKVEEANDKEEEKLTVQERIARRRAEAVKKIASKLSASA